VNALHVAALSAGILVVTFNLWDVVRTLVVPRTHSRSALARVTSCTRRAIRLVALACRSFESRDRVLAAGEPLGLLARLGAWLAVDVLGFGLLLWTSGHAGFAHALIEAGSSVCTLGFATERGTGVSVINIVAAATGLVIVALQIAYLPALYDTFNRRETLVTLLESRAGTPAWGPELLARHQLVNLQSNLPALYADWERWSADVAETHTTSPGLLHLRSPHPRNSWIVALIAVLDAAALQLAVDPQGAPAEARLCVRMGFTCLRDISRVWGIPFDPDPLPDAPISLTEEEFREGFEWIVQAGVRVTRSPEEAWPHFRGWRVNYEALAYALADRIDAPPAPWTGPRRMEPAGKAAIPLRPLDRRPDAPGPRPVVDKPGRRSRRRRSETS
jgi:hypothetical protein